MKLFPLIIIVFMLAGCGGRHDIGATLDRADRLLFVSPDSALALLDSVDSPTLSEADRARRAFLVTKARHFGDYPFTDDSLINIAVDYYAGRGDSIETQSYFLKSLAESNTDNIDASLLSAMMAYDCASRLNDYPYMGRAARQQSDLYSRLFAYKKSIEQDLLSVENFEKASMSDHAAWGKLNYAWTLVRCDSLTKAIGILNDLSKCHLLNDDQGFKYLFNETSAQLEHELKNYKTSNSLYYNAIMAGSSDISSELSQMSLNYIGLNKLDSALAYILKASETATTQRSKARVAFIESLINEKEGKYKEALANIRFYLKFADRDMENFLVDPYFALINDYYRETNIKNDVLLRNVNQERIIWGLMGIMAFITIVAIILLFRRRLKYKQNSIDLLDGELKKQVAVLSKTKSLNLSLQSEIRELLKDRFNIFNDLCATQIVNDHHSDKVIALNWKFQKIISLLKSDDGKTQLEKQLDISLDNICFKFRKQFPNLTSRVYCTCFYLFAGMSIDAISIILGCSSGSVYTSRSRIKKLISSSDAEDKLFFLTNL